MKNQIRNTNKQKNILLVSMEISCRINLNEEITTRGKGRKAKDKRE